MKTLKEKNFPLERALYGESDLKLISCTFDGEEDGESALKETSRVILENCYFNLRYPLWHADDVVITGCEMTEKCRAALWYTSGVSITDSILGGIKALRECDCVSLVRTKVTSPEFGWRTRNIDACDSEVEGEYPFFMASGLRFDKVRLKGKYSFQYTENVVIENSYLDTKDAFWHAKNVTVRNSTIRGEYLAWYSENLTLENCTIIGTQPLCYCKNLTLIDCRMVSADLSFEYSDVTATVFGNIDSVKNPASGRITADSIGEIIISGDSKHPCSCEITERNKSRRAS